MPVTAIEGPYIPRADGRFRDWLENFAAVAVRAPAAVGLSNRRAEALRSLARRYGLAYGQAIAPGTRNRVTVAEKNAVRREAWDAVRPIAMRIKHDKGIARQKKIELGVYPPQEGQSPIRPPRTAPQLEVVTIVKGRHRLRFTNPAGPSRSAKPYGAVAMQLLILVGKKAERSVKPSKRVLHPTRHVFDVLFAPAESRKTATYFGRWVTRRGKTGPWSRPLAVTIV